MDNQINLWSEKVSVMINNRGERQPEEQEEPQTYTNENFFVKKPLILSICTKAD